MSLLRLQRRAKNLFSGRGSEEIGIADRPPISVERRIGIYQEAFQIRMVESLTEDFPTVLKILGELRFEQLISDYLVKYPSRFASVSEVGVFLERFILESTWGEEPPFLSEVARLDWQTVLSSIAVDSDPVNFSQLNRIPPEELSEIVLQLHPSVRFLESPWPVHEADSGHELNPRLTRLVIVRTHGDVNLFEVDSEAWKILQGIAERKSLGELIPLLSEASEQKVFGWFSDWAAAGMISGFAKREVKD